MLPAHPPLLSQADERLHCPALSGVAFQYQKPTAAQARHRLLPLQTRVTLRIRKRTLFLHADDNDSETKDKRFWVPCTPRTCQRRVCDPGPGAGRSPRGPPPPFSVLQLQRLTPPNSELWLPQDARPATLSVPRDAPPPGEENDLWEGTNGVALSTMCQSTSAKPGSRMLDEALVLGHPWYPRVGEPLRLPCSMTELPYN